MFALLQVGDTHTAYSRNRDVGSQYNTFPSLLRRQKTLPRPLLGEGHSGKKGFQTAFIVSDRWRFLWSGNWVKMEGRVAPGGGGPRPKQRPHSPRVPFVVAAAIFV